METQKDSTYVIYVVYHEENNSKIKNDNFVYIGVNEIYKKNKSSNVILEYELTKYNPFLQKRGYMETTAYLHIYWNKLYKNKEMIGFFQYDMIHHNNYDSLNNNTIYTINTGQYIVKNKNWNHLMVPHLRNLDYLIKSYNKHFSKNYSLNELENMPLSVWQTNIYPIKIYEKLCGWLELLVEEIYPWSNEPPYETHFGSVGGYTERALSIFNAFEIYEGVKYNFLNISHFTESPIVKLQYNNKSFLNNYSQDVHTKFIDNVTGNYNVNYCMFKSQCYLNNVLYSCERINKNGRNGLFFKRDDWDVPKEYAFDIEGEDPRLVILNEKVYVVFTCVFNHKDIHRGIALTEFDNYNPIFLKLKNNKFNRVEKNWAPFVKDNVLHFVYNYDPLIILKYDLNIYGLCDVIFIQNNVNMPIYINDKYLRGGSNLIHYKNEYYIGACHSRLHYKGIYYNTHIVILDTNKWTITYLSKPVMYCYNDNKLKLNTLHNTNIIHHKSILPFMSDNLHNLQAPCSLYKRDDKYFITIDINCHITLLYELIIDIPINSDKQFKQGEIETITYTYNKNFIDN
uniref:Uncharacterized protein n=1 Tax=viral metagenome TaxID=1070528 RepID=A0A6C0JPT3_9ZZZZ